MICTRLDQCPVAATRASGTGFCSNPNKAGGMACGARDATDSSAADSCNATGSRVEGYMASASNVKVTSPTNTATVNNV